LALSQLSVDQRVKMPMNNEEHSLKPATIDPNIWINRPKSQFTQDQEFNFQEKTSESFAGLKNQPRYYPSSLPLDDKRSPAYKCFIQGFHRQSV